MAPSIKATKEMKPGGKDIRAFFGKGGSQSQLKTSQGSIREQAIEISDEESGHPVKTTVQKTNGTYKESPAHKVKSEQAMDADSNEILVKPVHKPKKRVLAISSSEDEEERKSSPPKKKKLDLSAPKASSSKTASSSNPKPAAKSPTNSKPKPKPKPKKLKDEYVDDMISESDSEDYSEGEEDDKRPSKSTGKKKAPSKKVPAKKAVGKNDEKEDVIQPPDKPKFNWAAAKAAKLAGPSAHGSKEVPDGDPNALNGLSLVFTGELSAFAREEAVDLAKRFGARVVLQPSSKTDYVVLGDNAGPSKLAAIRKHNLRTLNEDEFLNLIGTRKGVVDAKTAKKQEKEREQIEEAARAMEKREKKAMKEKQVQGSSKGPDVGSQLWTTRYAPQTLKEICGNKGQVEKLQTWLRDWSNSLKADFKKPGKSGMNVFRAVMITGPPGIGKTTSAHLCAKLEGFTPIELNASDARSKKLVENSTNIMNTSLDGWMGHGKGTNAAGIEISNRSCLIMDEVDGMSAGDRGGVGALNQLIKKTKIPIICIANDRTAIKLKPLVNNTFNLSFRKPEAAAIRSRILTIAFKEKMKIPANVIDQLVAGAQSDIRQVLNMLSTWKLSNNTMDFDEGKTLAKMNEKYAVMTPFNVTNKILGPYMFSPTARETLGEKMELYFHDHSFVPLFIQENYLKTEPARLRNLSGPEKILRELALMDQAASSISDGDLVDALIHGPEQHWSLMPLHAVCSTIRPASFVYGLGAGYGGANGMTFPQWLGQNSKQNKLQQQLADVQIRMRLKVSGDKPEIRQSYIPALFPQIVKPLMDDGASSVDDVIERMDEYYLSKDDWDTVIELGVGDHKDDLVLKKVSTATKTALTRKYNAGDHPIPFHKAQDFGKPAKKLGGGPAPDLEDVFDAVDDVEEEDKQEDISDDISKDKLIKQSKVRGKAKASAKAKAKS